MISLIFRAPAQRVPRAATGHCVKLILAIVLVAATASSVVAAAPSWVFDRGQFSHDPATGARVAQYSRIPPVEPLADPRATTSVYRRSRTILRGAEGSTDSYYQVQSFGNGRGGMDAEWERFNDAWKDSYTAGGYDRGRYGYGPYGYGRGYSSYGRPVYPHGGDPAYGRSPGYGGGYPVPYGE